jgi:hypothetical protein
MSGEQYPWYASVEDDSVEQGDIFEACPVFRLPPEAVDRSITEIAVEWVPYDLIVMSQSCDLVAGREKIEDVLLCAVWTRSEALGGASKNDLEQIRRGQRPRYHLLAESKLASGTRDVRVVDFGEVYSLPLKLLRRRATQAGQGARLRLLPPYREHLSQGFARYFMRVGLPVDIPPFK